jgi:hypothetical protein
VTEAKDPVHIFSLSEKGARDAHLNHRDALFEHNRLSMMRIYPFAFRVNSSNLDPSFYWRRGAQLVALNWQNLDKGMMLNHGMFAGTQGWVIKPTGYKSSESHANSISRETLELTIEVFAAQDLSLPPSDHSEKWFRPYVNCQLHVEEPDSPVAVGQDDVSSDSEKSSYRRCTKSKSGINPVFVGQKLEFPAVSGVVEKLSFLRYVELRISLTLAWSILLSLCFFFFFSRPPPNSLLCLLLPPVPRAVVSHSRIDRGDPCDIELEELVMQELFGQILETGLLLNLAAALLGQSCIILGENRARPFFRFPAFGIRWTCCTTIMNDPLLTTFYDVGSKSRMTRSVVTRWPRGLAFGLTDFEKATGSSIFSTAPEKRQGAYYWFASRRRRPEQTACDGSLCLESLCGAAHILFIRIQGLKCISLLRSRAHTPYRAA